MAYTLVCTQALLTNNQFFQSKLLLPLSWIMIVVLMRVSTLAKIAILYFLCVRSLTSITPLGQLLVTPRCVSCRYQISQLFTWQMVTSSRSWEQHRSFTLTNITVKVGLQNAYQVHFDIEIMSSHDSLSDFFLVLTSEISEHWCINRLYKKAHLVRQVGLQPTTQRVM